MVEAVACFPHRQDSTGRHIYVTLRYVKLRYDAVCYITISYFTLRYANTTLATGCNSKT